MQTMNAELEQLIGKVIGDLGGTANAALVIVGDRLGLYRTLARIGPATSHELARHTGTHERYIREWLAAQAASSYVSYDPVTNRFSMSREQAMLFADENSPVYMTGGFFAAASAITDERHLAEAFRTGRGIAWSDHHDCLFCGTEKFFRPSYAGNLVQSWIPSLGAMHARLQAGGIVADLGCGRGCSTVVMAKAYPASTFVGFDSHAASIEHARTVAAEQDLPNVRFEVATAQGFTRIDGDGGYDLVAIFDALHDMGDPRRGPSRARDVESGRDLDDRRAGRERSAGREPQPAGPRLLCPLHGHLCPLGLEPGWRRIARGPGRTGRARGRGHQQRLLQLPTRHEDPVQPRVRSQAMTGDLVVAAGMPGRPFFESTTAPVASSLEQGPTAR